MATLASEAGSGTGTPAGGSVQEAPKRGVVTRAESGGYWVSLGGTEFLCALRGRLKKRQLRVSNLLVVGDEVTVGVLPDGRGVCALGPPARLQAPPSRAVHRHGPARGSPAARGGQQVRPRGRTGHPFLGRPAPRDGSSGGPGQRLRWPGRAGTPGAPGGTGLLPGLNPLPGGGYLADTPGIRELGLFEEAVDELGSVFPEIEAAAARCRFRNCTHTHEPDCAVKEAVERGEIDEDRYRNYVRLRKRL